MRRSPGSIRRRSPRPSRPARPPGTCASSHPGVGEWAGTSWLDATGSTVDLTKFGDLIADIARRLGEAGDPDTLEQRRAKAFGVVADVHAGADLDELIAALVTPGGGSGAGAAPADPGPGPAALHPPRRRGPRGRDRHRRGARRGDRGADRGLAGPAHRRRRTGARHSRGGPGPRRCGGPPRPAAPDGRTGQAHRPAVRVPLLPDPRPRLRPRPHRPVLPADDTGPPGQTNPQNLAPLCRRHHRAKTAKRWRYERNPDGSLRLDLAPGTTATSSRHGGTLALPD